MRRGEVWWARLPSPIGERPVLLLSRDEAYDRRASITIAPITSKIRNLQVEVRVGRAEGLRRDSAINLDDIQTIVRTRVLNQIGRVVPDKMRVVDEAIRFALDLPRFQE